MPPCARSDRDAEPVILRHRLLLLRIIDRYLLRELAQSFLGVAAVLLLISIGETVIAVLNQVARGRVPADLLVAMIGLRAIDGLNVMLPLAACCWPMGDSIETARWLF